MKRKLDVTGYMQYLAVIVVVLILAIGFVAFMVRGSDSPGGGDDWNPITVNLYLDTSAELDVGTLDARTASIENADYTTETKRTNLQLKNLGWWFDEYNGQIKCSLYIGNEFVASGSENVLLEETWTGWNIEPNSVDFSFGPIEADEGQSLKIVYQLGFDAPFDASDKVTLEGSV